MTNSRLGSYTRKLVNLARRDRMIRDLDGRKRMLDEKVRMLSIQMAEDLKKIHEGTLDQQKLMHIVANADPLLTQFLLRKITGYQVAIAEAVRKTSESL